MHKNILKRFENIQNSLCPRFGERPVPDSLERKWHFSSYECTSFFTIFTEPQRSNSVNAPFVLTSRNFWPHRSHSHETLRMCFLTAIFVLYNDRRCRFITHTNPSHLLVVQITLCVSSFLIRFTTLFSFLQTKV